MTELVEKLHKPVPRYTSYPTYVDFKPLDPQVYAAKLEALKDKDEPLSLYFHIPFCKTMCLYCACSVVLNRKEENEERYVEYLIREIDLLTERCGKNKKVFQLHFGGGTPTKLSPLLFDKLFAKITASFNIDFSKEVAIEIDPRTVLENSGEKLRLLKNWGFNRVSFGVQDTNPKVQEAIKRRQSLDMTVTTYSLARKLGFKGINIDLIYGLPYQTMQTFAKTVDDILKLRPDRIALFSYAKVPWLKPHQKAIPDDTLPKTDEKFAIYSYARNAFTEKGYLAIGMDHFALENDEIAKAYHEKRLQRNFQGYTCRYAEQMISLGMTAIGLVENTYVQNRKTLEEYYQSIEKGVLPVFFGKEMTPEDILRKKVIHTLMCDFSLDKREIEEEFGIRFDAHFAESLEKIKSFEKDGLVTNLPHQIAVAPLGQLFIRNIAHCFDAYAQAIPKERFSQSI